LDEVVVVNGKRPLILGNKAKVKLYRKHSGYPGGLQERTILHILDGPNWKRVVEQAVSKMLPKNNLRKQWLTKLHVYPDLYHDIDFLPQF
jgi:large subunit ribosomal protein L13